MELKRSMANFAAAEPDPRIYELICTRLVVPPGEMAFLDDTEAWVAGARDAGIHAVRY